MSAPTPAKANAVADNSTRGLLSDRGSSRREGARAMAENDRHARRSHRAFLSGTGRRRYSASGRPPQWPRPTINWLGPHQSGKFDGGRKNGRRPRGSALQRIGDCDALRLEPAEERMMTTTAARRRSTAHSAARVPRAALRRAGRRRGPARRRSRAALTEAMPAISPRAASPRDARLPAPLHTRAGGARRAVGRRLLQSSDRRAAEARRGALTV